MRIVFLDFDGVLNHSEFLSSVQRRWDETKNRNPDFGEMIDERAVKLVDRICTEGDAEVVISSTWRLTNPLGQLNHWLRSKGLSRDIRSKTGSRSRTGARGSEIQEWLNDNDWLDIESFVILDDDSDMEHLMPHLVQTHFSSGLLEDHVPMALDVLNGKLRR